MVAVAAWAVACGGAPARKRAADLPAPWIDTAPAIDARADPPRPRPAPPAVVIRGATILTAAGDRFERGVLVLEGGEVRYVGAGPGEVPAGAVELDATGRFVTPGIIDTHSHIGVYPRPSAEAHYDGNEMSAPVTAGVRAEYGYFPQDPSIERANAGGITVAQILPGSANLIGGMGFTIEMRRANTADEVRFPGAPPTLKMACGENPKRTHGQKGGPQTRMGEYAAFRDWFYKAAEYDAAWRVYREERAHWERKRARAAERGDAKAGGEKAPAPPARDSTLEVLAGVLRGEVLPQIHCYRADEIRQMVAIADELGFAIRGFHHALEAYKVRDLLVARDISISTWADWWGFKMEAFDGIPENAALFAASGGRAVIHSDSSIGIQRLNQEAAKAMYAGRAAGIEITEDAALRWITVNAAWTLGIDGVTGTLEPGKRADVVVWSAHPFSVYARADLVFIAGERVYDRAAGMQPSDFELGNSALGGGAR